MTPAEHSAVAEAIAALDEIIAEHDRPVRPMMYDAEQHPFGITMKIPSDEQIASMELWARVRTTLASLRAVANAPAESSRVAIWSGEHSAYWRTNGAGYTTDIRSIGSYTLEDAKARTKHCGPEKMIEIIPFSAPVDQSDAGRDGVIEECAKMINPKAFATWDEEYLSKRSGDAMFSGSVGQMNAARALAKEIVAFVARALASAPSEAPKPPGQEPGGDPGVGRGEDALAHKILGDHCACYADAWPAKTCDTERAAVAKIIRDAAIPTADRDAIREAFAVARMAIDPGSMIGHSALKQIADALALIREG